MPAPIAGSSAVAAIGRLARVPPIPASSPHRHRTESSPRASWESRSGSPCSWTKHLSCQPTHRLLADWATQGLDLLSGTVTDGLGHLAPLFEPVYRALVRHGRKQALWHADEARWRGFARIEGKVGSRWYLWASHSAEVVVFVRAAGQSHAVPEEHCGPVAGRGILVVDRDKAYQAIDEVKSGQIVLAFCWAHVRRDFVRWARSWPDQEGGASEWAAGIGTPYHLNDERLKVRDDAAAFAVADNALRAAVTSFGERGAEP